MNALRRRPRLALVSTLAAAAGALALASGIAVGAPVADAGTPAPTPSPSTPASPAAAPAARTAPAASAPATASTVALPASWKGTLLTESNIASPIELGTYLSVNDYAGATSYTARDLSQSELMAADDIVIDGHVYTGACQTGTHVGGEPASCRLVGDDGSTGYVSLAASEAPYGHTLMTARFGLDAQKTALPAGTPIIRAYVDDAEVLAALTPAKVADGLTNDALISQSEDHDGPMPKVRTSCTLTPDHQHALCTVSGTPEGGADGTWYGTVQITPDETMVLMFGRLGD